MHSKSPAFDPIVTWSFKSLTSKHMWIFNLLTHILQVFIQLKFIEIDISINYIN